VIYCTDVESAKQTRKVDGLIGRQAVTRLGVHQLLSRQRACRESQQYRQAAVWMILDGDGGGFRDATPMEWRCARWNRVEWMFIWIIEGLI